MTILTILNCCRTSDKTESLRTKFEEWKKEQIGAGRFLSHDNCNPTFVANQDKDSIQYLGVPDKVNFHYADIKNDNQIDALVTFTPEQCDGGNGSMWTQFQLLILSKDGDYITNDIFFDDIGKDLKGFYHLDSAMTNELLGTYYEFKEDDGHCCPSMKTPLTIMFDTKELRKN